MDVPSFGLPFVRTDRVDRYNATQRNATQRPNASVLPNWELFLAKLPFSSLEQFSHEQGPETFRAHFGWHNCLCIFKTKVSRGTKLCSYLNFHSLQNIWKDQLYRTSGSEFCQWLFGPEKFSGLSRNGPQLSQFDRPDVLQIADPPMRTDQGPVSPRKSRERLGPENCNPLVLKSWSFNMLLRKEKQGGLRSSMA